MIIAVMDCAGEWEAIGVKMSTLEEELEEAGE